MSTSAIPQTGAEALAAAIEKANLAKIESDKNIPAILLEPTLQLHYDILVDSITGESPNAYEQNVMILKGRVTEGDLHRAGVDIKWLIDSGSIESAGHHLA